MTRTTVAEAREAFAQLVRTVALDQSIGVLVLQEGSPSNGRAWRLFLQKAGSSGLWPPLDLPEYLGWSTAEATAALYHLRCGYMSGLDHDLRTA